MIPNNVGPVFPRGDDIVPSIFVEIFEVNLQAIINFTGYRKEVSPAYQQVWIFYFRPWLPR